MVLLTRFFRTVLTGLCLFQAISAAVHPINDSTTGTFEYPYRLFSPSQASSTNKLPLVIHLHGAGERGSENQKQVQSHIQPLLDLTQEQAATRAYMVAPQLPSGQGWNGTKVRNLVEHLIANHHIDATRVYVLGLSLGGQGVWRSLAAGGDVFAAGVPLSAVRDSSSSAAIIAANGTPVWAFHGTADGVVGVAHTGT